MAWTEERVQLLKQYWEEGRSASQIAELLGEGLSRNAVIGKAHRIGLSARPSPLKGEAATDTAKPARRSRKKSAGADQPASAAAAATASSHQEDSSASDEQAGNEPASSEHASAPRPHPASTRRAAPRPKDAPVTLLDLNDRICKWPLGHPDEPDFHFCGKPANPGFPYCVDHCLVAYQAQLPKRDRPGEGGRPPFLPNLPRPR